MTDSCSEFMRREDPAGLSGNAGAQSTFVGVVHPDDELRFGEEQTLAEGPNPWGVGGIDPSVLDNEPTELAALGVAAGEAAHYRQILSEAYAALKNRLLVYVPTQDYLRKVLKYGQERNEILMLVAKLEEAKKGHKVIAEFIDHEDKLRETHAQIRALLEAVPISKEQPTDITAAYGDLLECLALAGNIKHFTQLAVQLEENYKQNYYTALSTEITLSLQEIEAYASAPISTPKPMLAITAQALTRSDIKEGVQTRLNLIQASFASLQEDLRNWLQGKTPEFPPALALYSAYYEVIKANLHYIEVFLTSQN